LKDVALVMAGGELRVLDPNIVATSGICGGRIIEWGGVRRWISEEMFL
jgi:hypothetical protein